MEQYGIPAEVWKHMGDDLEFGRQIRLLENWFGLSQDDHTMEVFGLGDWCKGFSEKKKGLPMVFIGFEKA